MLQLETIQGDTLHICHIALFLFQIFGCRGGHSKVSLDYLSGCLDCCNWKRFKETTRTTGIAHTSHLSLFFPSDIWLKRGTGWQQNDNKCCDFFAHLFWPPQWKPGSSQAAGPSIPLFWMFLFILTSGDYLLQILFMGFTIDMSGHWLLVHYSNLHSSKRCTSIGTGIRPLWQAFSWFICSCNI